MNTRYLSKFLCVILIVNSAISCSPENQDGKCEIEMLKEFYVAHCSLYHLSQDNKRTDSLVDKYCTPRLSAIIKAINEQSYYEHDPLTKDAGIDSLSLKTLIVKKDPQKTNGFIVTFSVIQDAPDMSKVKTDVIIHLTVVRENDKFKIDEIDF